MYEDTAYGVAQTRGLRRAAKDANIELVMDEVIGRPLRNMSVNWKRIASGPHLVARKDAQLAGISQRLPSLRALYATGGTGADETLPAASSAIGHRVFAD